VLIAAEETEFEGLPSLDLKESDLDSPAKAELVKKVIRDRIQYWKNYIIAATDEKQIIDARRNLANDFYRYGSHNYQYTFAKEASDMLTGLLSGELNPADPLKLAKEVNLAMALTRMQRVPIKDAFEKMVVNPNPGVRYIGWTGYAQIMQPLLAQGGDTRSKFLDTLTTVSQKEKSPSVMRGIYRTLRIPRDITSNFQKDKAAHAKMLAVLVGMWSRQCLMVQQGDEAAAEAAREGVATILSYDSVITTEPDKRLQLMQMIIDVMSASGKAFDDALNASAEAKANYEKQKIVANARAVDRVAVSLGVNEQLIRECENALNSLTNSQHEYVAQGFRSSEDLGAAVRIGIIKWVDELKKLGVKEPKTEQPAATVGK